MIPATALDYLMWAAHFGGHVVLAIAHHHFRESGIELRYSGLAESE
jgi:hypothetical protein